MPEQVNVPAVGKVDRRWVFAGLAASAGIVVYAYWRRSQEGAAAGEPGGEGSEYVPEDWSPDAYVGATAPGGETYDPSITEAPPTTNPAWVRFVTGLLEAAGFESGFIVTALGKWFAGNPLTETEKQLVQSAIGLGGNPPSGPIPIISAPGTPTTPPTTPPSSNKLATPTLRVSAGDPRNTNYLLSWSKVPGAQSYLLKRELGPGSPSGIVVIGTSRRTPALKRRYTYQYRVQARAVGKLPSNWSAPVRFKVPAR
jgi:hypothetical protein